MAAPTRTKSAKKMAWKKGRDPNRGAAPQKLGIGAGRPSAFLLSIPTGGRLGVNRSRSSEATNLNFLAESRPSTLSRKKQLQTNLLKSVGKKGHVCCSFENTDQLIVPQSYSTAESGRGLIMRRAARSSPHRPSVYGLLCSRSCGVSQNRRNLPRR